MQHFAERRRRSCTTETIRVEIANTQIAIACRLSIFLSRAKQIFVEFDTWMDVSTMQHTHLHLYIYTHATHVSIHTQDGANANKLRAGLFQWVFMTPEYFYNCGQYALEGRTVDLLSFDELHTRIDQGSSRPSFAHFPRVFQELQNRQGSRIPIFACSGTLPDDWEEPLKDLVALRNPRTFRTDMDRPNIFINFRPKGRESKQDAKLIAEILRTPLPDAEEDGAPRYGSGIVYCSTRDQAETMSKYLNSGCGKKDMKVTCGHFCGAGKRDASGKLTDEAKTDEERKRKLLIDWRNDDVQVVAATDAFGMVSPHLIM